MLGGYGVLYTSTCFIPCLFDLISAVGFVNGSVRVLDSLTLRDEVQEPFRYARDAITHIEFSHDSQFLATAVSFLSLAAFFPPPYVEGYRFCNLFCLFICFFVCLFFCLFIRIYFFSSTRLLLLMTICRYLPLVVRETYLPQGHFGVCACMHLSVCPSKIVPKFCTVVHCNPSPDDKILDWSKLKQIEEDIFSSAFKMKNKCHIG